MKLLPLDSCSLIAVLFGVYFTFSESSLLTDSRAVPQLPRRFLLTVESMNKITKRGRSVKQYYDFANNLYREDYHTRKNTESSKVGKGPLTEIRNHTSNFAYRYSQLNKKCANFTSQCTSNLLQTSTGSDWQLMVSCGILSLYEKSDVPKIYSGNQTVRNALCDVWISTRKNWPDNRQGELVFKWFFIRKPWVYNNQTQVPLRLEVDGQIQLNSSVNVTVASRISFFAFETSFWSDEVFKIPDFCSGEEPGGGGDHDGGDNKEVHPKDAKIYSRRHVAQVATVVGIICIVVSTTTCGLYHFCKTRRARRNRFY